MPAYNTANWVRSEWYPNFPSLRVSVALLFYNINSTFFIWFWAWLFLDLGLGLGLVNNVGSRIQSKDFSRFCISWAIVLHVRRRALYTVQHRYCTPYILATEVTTSVSRYKTVRWKAHDEKVWKKIVYFVKHFLYQLPQKISSGSKIFLF